jgi:hypothetical protein
MHPLGQFRSYIPVGFQQNINRRTIAARTYDSLLRTGGKTPVQGYRTQTYIPLGKKTYFLFSYTFTSTFDLILVSLDDLSGTIGTDGPMCHPGLFSLQKCVKGFKNKRRMRWTPGEIKVHGN